MTAPEPDEGARWRQATRLAGVPEPDAARVELVNIRILCERHGVPPADGNGELRSTVAMVEEALIRRPPVDTEPDWVASRYLLDHPTPGGPHG